MAIKNGDFVRISYTGKLEDGSVFDTTEENVAKEKNIYNQRMIYKPVLIIVGKHQVIAGLDESLIGMEKGNEKAVAITPEKAFGQKKNDLINVVPLSHFEKQKMNPSPGMFVQINGKEGMIKSVGAGRVIVDFNHPLAGRTLNYHMKVEEVLDTPEQKINALFADAGLDGSVSMNKDVLTVACKADPSENYIFRKQTFLSWAREVKEINKILFNEEYQLAEAKAVKKQ